MRAIVLKIAAIGLCAVSGAGLAGRTEALDNAQHFNSKSHIPLIDQAGEVTQAIYRALPSMPKILPSLEKKDNWFMRGDIGWLWPQLNDSLTANNGSGYPAPQNVDAYSASMNSQTMLAIVAGYRWYNDRTWLPARALALRYQHFFSQNINGRVTQYSLPQFNNYTYTWNMNANVYSVYSKIDLVKQGRFMLYIDGGVGAAQNNTRSYQEMVLSGVSARISPGFGANTNMQFAYNAGVGVDFNISHQVMLSLGYSYQSLGALLSGPGQLTWSGSTLNLGNLSGSSLLVGVTYFIDDSFYKA